MITETQSPLTDHCSAALAEMRAQLAAQRRRNAPHAMLLAALIRLLETLLAIILDFQAGRLAPRACAVAHSEAKSAEVATQGPGDARPVDARRPAPPVRRKGWVPACAGMTNRIDTTTQQTAVAPARARRRIAAPARLSIRRAARQRHARHMHAMPSVATRPKDLDSKNRFLGAKPWRGYFVTISKRKYRLAPRVPRLPWPLRPTGAEGEAVLYSADSTQLFNALLGAAPTLVETGLPSLNRISVGMPRTA